MKKKREKMQKLSIPTINELEKELKREKYRSNYGKTFRSTIYILIIVAAMAILVATIFLPVLQIYGSSMNPTLSGGDIVISLKHSKFKKGEVIAFYYNNKILIKRVIANAGEWVDIDKNGNVTVDGKEFDEPYVKEKALGDCDITLPYQVPDGKVFVMGDHRSVSVDSRKSAVGCVAEEQIVGKLVFRIWPLKKMGPIN